MTTALIWHEHMMWFDAGMFAGPMQAVGWVEPGEAAENPAAKRRSKNLLDASGFIEKIAPHSIRHRVPIDRGEGSQRGRALRPGR